MEKVNVIQINKKIFYEKLLLEFIADECYHSAALIRDEIKNIDPLDFLELEEVIDGYYTLTDSKEI